MFGGNKKNNIVDEIETLIGENTVLQGSIKSKGSIRIDGRLEGSVLEGNQVIVGVKGYVQGDINANSVVVGGKINGNVTAKENIELKPGGQLLGDIHTSVLSIGEGAIFEGHCVMTSDQTKVIDVGEESIPSHQTKIR